MSTIIHNKLKNLGGRKVKLILDNLDKCAIYYGFVKDLDEEYVTIRLDKSEKEIIIKISIIMEVLIYEREDV